jgi:hypothetical protein
MHAGARNSGGRRAAHRVERFERRVERDLAAREGERRRECRSWPGQPFSGV